MKRPFVFDYTDYRQLVRDLIATYPKAGHGQFSRIAQALRTNTVTISQIFSGKRELSTEQALDLSKFFGFSDLETKYFLCLVQWERTSYHELKSHLEDELRAIRSQSRELKRMIPPSTELSEEQKATFYSDWTYSAIRIACSLNDGQDPDAISKFLNIPRAKVQKILRFLKQNGLVTEKNGTYRVGNRSTHLDSKSPFVKARQISWRLKATDFMDAERFPHSLFYTAPCSLSKKDFDEFRKELVELIQKFSKRISETDPEILACFNIDYFSFETSR